MLNVSVLRRFLRRCFLRLFKKSVVLNVARNPRSQGLRRALVYYKTDPFFLPTLLQDFSHTNNVEIKIIVNVLDGFGFTVDLIDRTASDKAILKLVSSYNYDVFICNAAGNSAPNLPIIVENSHMPYRIFYAAGPDPTFSNSLVEQQHDRFQLRTGYNPVRRRLIPKSNSNYLTWFNSIIYMGNSFVRNSYLYADLPLFPVFPAPSERITTKSPVMDRNPNTFLYFGGSGLICKGLDLVLEAFDGLPHLNLSVCGSPDEKDFWSFYSDLLKRNPNIVFYGFLDTSKSSTREFIASHAYNIFPSCSEACATSVVTCMRLGVIPVVTPEVGIDVAPFGHEIKNRDVEAIRALVLELSTATQADISNRVEATLEASKVYSTARFRLLFDKAIGTIVS